MNLGTLRTHVGEKFGLDYANASTEQTLLTDWANEAVLQFLADTGLNTAVATIALTANQGDYGLPLTTSIIIRRLWATDAANQPVILEPISPEEMLSLRRSAGSAPTRYYSIEGNLLQIYPVPTANGTLNIVHTPVPTALSGVNDDPSNLANGSIPSRFHHVLEYWMSWRAGSHQDHAPSRSGQDYLALYESEISKSRARLRRASGGRLAPAKVGPPAWRGVYSSNDTDVTHP